MDNFREDVETALLDVFERTPQNERQVEVVADHASELRTALETRNNYDHELNVDLIVDKLEERSDGGPKWAWNNWLGSLEFTEAIPEGFQI